MDILTYVLCRRYAKKLVKSIETGFRFKGTVPTYADLPVSGQLTGDVWITEDTGYKWVWDGNSTPGQWIQNTDVNAWGEIYGDLENQVDLMNALNKKQDKKIYQTAADETIDGKTFPKVPGTLFDELFTEFDKGNSIALKTFDGSHEFVLLDADKTNDGTDDNYVFSVLGNNTIYSIKGKATDAFATVTYFKLTDSIQITPGQYPGYGPDDAVNALTFPTSKAVTDYVNTLQNGKPSIARVFGTKQELDTWYATATNLTSLPNTAYFSVLSDESHDYKNTIYKTEFHPEATPPAHTLTGPFEDADHAHYCDKYIEIQFGYAPPGKGPGTINETWLTADQLALLKADWVASNTDKNFMYRKRVTWIYDKRDKMLYMPMSAAVKGSYAHYYYMGFKQISTEAPVNAEIANLYFMAIVGNDSDPHVYRSSVNFGNFVRIYQKEVGHKTIDGMSVPDITENDINDIVVKLDEGSFTDLWYFPDDVNIKFCTILNASDTSLTLQLDHTTRVHYDVNTTVDPHTISITYDKKVYTIDNTSTDLQYPSAKAVYKKLLDTTTSTHTFTQDDGTTKDTLDILLKNNNGETVADLPLTFDDNLVQEERTQTLKNKTIKATENTINLYQETPKLNPTTAEEGELYVVPASNEDQRKGLYLKNPTGFDRIEINKNLFHRIDKMQDFLYKVEYRHGEMDYDFAKKVILAKYSNGFGGGCSAARVGKYFVRNYDWYYDNTCEFVVNTNSANGKFASIGMASNAGLTPDDVADENYSEKFSLIPFMMLDGINENGVCVSINVVPKDYGATHQTYAGREDMPAIMLPRYVLDHATSAAQIAQDIQDNLNVIASANYEYHLLISDPTTTIVIEWINNVTQVIDATTRPWITNFHIYNATFDSDNHVDFASVTDHGQGLERYNIIADDIAPIDPALTYLPVRDMVMLLASDVWFSFAYLAPDVTSPLFHKTEFTGIDPTYGDLKVSDPPSAFSAIYTAALDAFINCTRDDPKVWQTVHTSMYDMEELKMYVCTQTFEVGVPDLDKDILRFSLYNSVWFVDDWDMREYLNFWEDM